MSSKRGLGKNLSELLNNSRRTVNLGSFTDNDLTDEQREKTNQSSARADVDAKGDGLAQVAVDSIHRGRYQPRRVFDQDALQELADSIKAQGLIQPVVLRPVGNGYELIAGERRWRAAQLAGLDKIPAVIQDISDQAALAIGLIENIQRENLNPIEEAQALRRLIDEFGLSQAQVAESVGRSRSTVTNLLRLLNLNHDVRMFLEHGDLEVGHAKALLALDDRDQHQVAMIVVDRNLSVRETEKLVKHHQQPKSAPPAATADPNIVNLQQRLSDQLGAKVVLQQTSCGKGKLVIHYHSHDALEGILAHIR